MEGNVPQLVVSQDEVPPRVCGDVGATGVQEIAEINDVNLVSNLPEINFLWKKRTSPGSLSTNTGSPRRSTMAENLSISMEARSPFLE